MTQSTLVSSPKKTANKFSRNFNRLPLQVFSSVFVITIVFSPLFGKYLGKLGSRSVFLAGTFLTGSTTILFGLLQWIQNGTLFFWLSLIIRICSAIGESAYFSALYPLVNQVRCFIIFDRDSGPRIDFYCHVVKNESTVRLYSTRVSEAKNSALSAR